MLTDPIWNTLRDNHCFNVIARQCFVDALRKGHLKGGAKAIRVPSNTTENTTTSFLVPHGSQARSGRSRNSCCGGGCLEELSATAGGPLAEHSRLPTAWSFSQMLPAKSRIGPRMQAIRNQGL